jgi:hypothetical protein
LNHRDTETQRRKKRRASTTDYTDNTDKKHKKFERHAEQIKLKARGQKQDRTSKITGPVLFLATGFNSIVCAQLSISAWALIRVIRG